MIKRGDRIFLNGFSTFELAQIAGQSFIVIKKPSGQNLFLTCRFEIKLLTFLKYDETYQQHQELELISLGVGKQ